MPWNLITTPMRTSLWREGFIPYANLQREINRAFDSLFESVGGASDSVAAAASSVLRIDVREDEHAFHVTADVAGMKEEDIAVTFHEGILTIRGEKKVDRDDKSDTWHLVERTKGSFMRQIGVPNTVDSTAIEAIVENGVLRVTLPKQPDSKVEARKIVVKKT